MPESLIIVESPTKVKTLKKFLGSDFEVKASLGHVKDLPRKKLGIDTENKFEPTYEIIKEKKKTVTELKKSAKNVKNIYLAPDPDREGEAIAWHIAQELGAQGKNVYRVLFNDLTRNTILQAIEHPQHLDTNKYEAQQTRRILDRLVGYQISPLLWQKVKRGLSAGRVQSVAVRLICDRHEEIKNFVPEEYWTIAAQLQGGTPPDFEARLIKINGKKAKIPNEEQAKETLKGLEDASFTVQKIEKKETKRNPAPPFTTSKLQQEASRKFGFSARKTMTIAQKLYEGIELGQEGSVGLITYMRTDSVRIAQEALDEAREYIKENYSAEFLPSRARKFKTSKSAQDAHEAIRPASTLYSPKDVEAYLDKSEFRLYQLIWNRFIASQMNPAVFDQTVIDISAGSCLFRASGSVMKFSGFTILYTESKEEKPAENAAKEGEEDDNGIGKILPELSEGEILTLLALIPQQHFTQPPPRFSEATLVKELEERGIGRPSTYAAIISTIQEREYVKIDNRRFFPTELGMLVNELLVNNFPNILDVSFTASMEDKLDLIEEGKVSRLETLTGFYQPFEQELKHAKEKMRNVKSEETPTDEICEKCGSPMIIKWGRNGKFIACSNYPACKNTRNIVQGEDGQVSPLREQPTDIVCEKCGKPMVIKEGRFGRFLGCSGYPECKNIKSIDIGVSCPEEGCKGKLCEKRTRKGRIFYGCSSYPACTYALWNKPVPETCPKCGHPFLIEKSYRGKGPVKSCPNKDCDYREE